MTINTQPFAVSPVSQVLLDVNSATSSMRNSYEVVKKTLEASNESYTYSKSLGAEEIRRYFDEVYIQGGNLDIYA